MTDVTTQERIVALEIELDLWKEEVRKLTLDNAFLRDEIAKLRRAIADRIQDPSGEL